jgi:hypothetical protein
VGQVGAPAATAPVVVVLPGDGVVAPGAVVGGGEVELVLPLLLPLLAPEPQPAKAAPTIKRPSTKGTRGLTPTSIRPRLILARGRPHRRVVSQPGVWLERGRDPIDPYPWGPQVRRARATLAP